MNLEEAIEFIGRHHRGVLATTRGDGLPQLSPVIAVPDGNGRIVVSSRETAYKTKNLLRIPFASLCVIEDKWFGQWIQVEGDVEVLHLPDAMEPLIDYYRRGVGETNWEEYREGMVKERRVLLRMTVVRAGPNVSG